MTAALENRSLAERFARLPATRRDAFLSKLRPTQAEALLYAWRFWARPSQLAPADPLWSVVLHRAGRGAGKTRGACEWIRERVDAGEARSVGLIAPTLADARETMLGEGRENARGEGLLNVWPARQRPKWEPSKRRITFHTGAVATLYTAEEPEIRGPNFDTVWIDELAKFRFLDAIWSNLEMALRKPGVTPPRMWITTTPRPLALLRELEADPFTRVIRGSTFDNAANLAPQFLARMKARYAGSRLGRQELYGEYLSDNPDALFRQVEIDRARVSVAPERFEQIVVGVDPAVSTGRSSDDTGIVIAGATTSGALFVIEDLTGRHTPDAWASIVVAACDRWRARAGSVMVVAETNRGGDLVQATLRSKRASLPLALVRATSGKAVRAEPVSALYAIGRVAHVGHLPELEQEITEFAPRGDGPSPNRLDALVWALWQLARLDIDAPGAMSSEALPPNGFRFDPLAENSRGELVVGGGAVADGVGGGWGDDISGRFL